MAQGIFDGIRTHTMRKMQNEDSAENENKKIGDPHLYKQNIRLSQSIQHKLNTK